MHERDERRSVEGSRDARREAPEGAGGRTEPRSVLMSRVIGPANDTISLGRANEGLRNSRINTNARHTLLTTISRRYFRPLYEYSAADKIRRAPRASTVDLVSRFSQFTFNWGLVN